jgi:hypothetical protein
MIEQQFDIGDEVVYPKGSDRESLSTYVITDVVYCPSTDTQTYTLYDGTDKMWVSSVSLRFYNTPTRNKEEKKDEDKN